MDELPVAPPRRRHRLLTVPSSVVLLVCLFLPAVPGCHEPIVPITIPLAWGPHIVGLVALICVACAASATGDPRRFRPAAIVVAIGAALSLPWLALWTGPGMLVGLPLTLAGSAWLLVGTLVWIRDLRPLAPVPRAQVARLSGGPIRGLVPALAVLMCASYVAIVVEVPIARDPPPADDPPAVDVGHGIWGC